MEQQQPRQPEGDDAPEPIGEQELARQLFERINEAGVRKLGDIATVDGGEGEEDRAATQGPAEPPAEIRRDPLRDAPGRPEAEPGQERRIDANEARGWLDDFEHAADHLAEVRDEILAAYHDGREVTLDEWRLEATLNAIAIYADHMRTALTIMRNGGLRETGNERWFTTNGATDIGPYNTLAEALAEVRECSEEGGEAFIVYEQDPDPADAEAAGQ